MNENNDPGFIMKPVTPVTPPEGTVFKFRRPYNSMEYVYKEAEKAMQWLVDTVNKKAQR